MRGLYVVVMIRILLFVISFAASSNAQGYGNDSCGNTGDWSVYEGQCYSCIGDLVTWHSARSSCSQLGAHLVTISSSGIQAFLQNFCTYPFSWIGLNDISIEGDFVWDGTSEPVSYWNWIHREPSDTIGDENCVHLWAEHSYKWNDEHCDQWNFSYICQKHQDNNDCQPEPCQNNGTCIDLFNDYQCDCIAGFNGTNCENNIEYCSQLQDPCQNNGTCTYLVNGYKCNCGPGFNGTNCENGTYYNINNKCITSGPHRQ